MQILTFACCMSNHCLKQFWVIVYKNLRSKFGWSPQFWMKWMHYQHVFSKMSVILSVLSWVKVHPDFFQMNPCIFFPPLSICHYAWYMTAGSLFWQLRLITQTYSGFCYTIGHMSWQLRQHQDFWINQYLCLILGKYLQVYCISCFTVYRYFVWKMTTFTLQ